MATIKVIASEAAETIMFGPVAVRILEDGSNTDNRLSMTLSTLPPHTKPLPPHVHHMHDETFFVTKGTVRFGMSGEEHDVQVGSYAGAPVGAPHTFSNPFDEPAEFVTTFTPGFYVNFFRDMAKATASGKAPSDEEIMKVIEHYATEPA